MRDKSTVFMALIAIILVFSIFTQNFLAIYQKNIKESTNSSSNEERGVPLRNNNPIWSSIPKTGIISSSRNPRTRISEIVNEQPVYLPQDFIRVANRFTIPNFGDFAIIQQEIMIFLSEESNILDDPLGADIGFLFGSTTTNGTYSGNAAISSDLTMGFIDFEFQIPDTTTLLETHDIRPGNNVTILQYYPGGIYNKTAKIDSVPAFNHTDTFRLVGFSNVTALSPGFVNPVTGNKILHQGDNATVTLKAQSEGEAVPGVEISGIFQWDNGTEIPNGTKGITYYFYDPLTDQSTIITNSEGELNLFVNTTFPDSPQGNFSLKITGNFTGTGQFTSNYDGVDDNTNYDITHANLTIKNEYGKFSAVSPTYAGFVNPASGDETFRQGENASVVLKTTIPGSTFSPYAWWHFDESAGTTVSDSSGLGRNGIVYGLGYSWLPGSIDNGLNLSNGDYVDYGDIADFERNDSFSFEIWIKTTATNAGLLSKYNDTVSIGWVFFLNAGFPVLYLSDGLNIIFRFGKTPINDNNWHHIIATYDGSSTLNNTHIYIDGLLDDDPSTSLAGTLTNSIQADGNLITGKIGTFLTYNLTGTIDEIVIYNKSLSALEVSHRWNNGIGTEETFEVCIPDINITVTLHNKTDGTQIDNGTYGIFYYLQNAAGYSSDRTDGNGELLLIVNTSYPFTPEGNYYFNVSANFFETGYNGINFDGENESTNTWNISADFTISNENDIVEIQFISAVPKGVAPNPLDPPNANITIVTYRIVAIDAYGGQTYYPAYIPVNATLDAYPVGVTLTFAQGFVDNGTGWGYTNQSGYIAFNISVEFPTLYSAKTPSITAIFALDNTTAPSYDTSTFPYSHPNTAHRFMSIGTAPTPQTISIDPDFWVGDIDLIDQNVTSIHHEKSAYLTFEVFSPQTATKFSQVPVKIITSTPIPGLSLSYHVNNPQYGTSGYYLTDSNGRITLYVNLAYLSEINPVPITFNVTVDFENDSQIRWIGSFNAINALGQPDTLANFNKTWHFEQFFDKLEIDPEFILGDIKLFSQNDSVIRPGEGVALEFEVFSSQSTVKFVGVPVKIELNQPIDGVSLVFDTLRNGQYDGSQYRYTDGNGIIEVNISTTYLITPEVLTTIVLDLTVDFENDSHVRWIGSQHAGTDTLANYNITWHFEQYSNIQIDPDFITYEIIFSTTNESGNAVIRPGDGLIVTFKVQEEGGGSTLSNVPVNISFIENYDGVALSIYNHGGLQRTHYYYTTGTGEVSVIISTTLGVTPKNLLIQLKAIADFENDSNSIWFIGQKSFTPNFWSNSSYSDVTKTVTVAPQYFIGYIYKQYSNATLIQQEETLEIEFRLKLRFFGSSTDLFPSINDVNITIWVNNTDPADFNMFVIPSRNQDSAASSVTYYLKTNVSGITPEAKYNITARADYGAAQMLTYNITHFSVPTGKLSGIWVNGSYTNAYSINTQFFQVKNVDVLRVQVEKVIDTSHNDVGYNETNGFYEVYRITTNITINGTYKDATQDPVKLRDVVLAFNYTSGSVPYDLKTIQTDDYGFFKTNVTLPGSMALGDITIYGRDATYPDPQERRENLSQIRVVSTINLNDYNLAGYNGTAIYLGESLFATGTLRDDQGVLINSAELTGKLRVIGWNGSQEFGVEQFGSPSGGGTYQISFTIPLDYQKDSVYIRLNISQVLHYRANYSEILIDVYKGIQFVNFQIYFPYTNTYLSISNGGVYDITGVENRTIYINGTLQDSIGRDLGNKEVNDTWFGTKIRRMTNASGTFIIPYDFPGYENITGSWTLFHILDNGTSLSQNFSITLNWEVYDVTEPIFTIITPINIDTDALPYNDTTTIIVIVRDPNYLDGAVSVGLNITSVIIWIDNTSYHMVQGGGYNFSYIWDTSNVVDGFYNITISASDMAGNWNKTGTIWVVIDILKPTIVTNITPYNDSILPKTSVNITISANINDTASITGRNSGINESTITLWINGTSYNMIHDTGFNYYFIWNTSAVQDAFYNITITVSDNVGHWETTGTILVVIDIVKPTVSTNIALYNDTILQRSETNVPIYANITDIVSTTGRNSGINESTITLWINGTSYNMIHDTGIRYYYIWDTAAIQDAFYNITIVVKDNEHNWNIPESIFLVIDIVEPTISSNISAHNGEVVPTINGVFTISATIEDFASVTGRNSGINETTITLWIASTAFPMVHETGSNYSASVSFPLDAVVNITISVSDNAKNKYTLPPVFIVVDIIQPSGTINIELNELGYVVINPDGNAVVSGSLGDEKSLTGLNSGLNNETVTLSMINQATGKWVLNESISVVSGSYSYDWSIIFNANDPDTLTRNPLFTTTEAWLLHLAFEDNVGNTNYTEFPVRIDNFPPIIEIENIDEWPDKFDDEINMIISLSDVKSGIAFNTLKIMIYSNETQDLVATILIDDEQITVIETGVILLLDTSDYDNGIYFIQARIFDRSGNRQELIEYFTIRHSSPGMAFVNLFEFIIFNLLALGGGIGVAALYERFKKMKRP